VVPIQERLNSRLKETVGATNHRITKDDCNTFSCSDRLPCMGARYSDASARRSISTVTVRCRHDKRPREGRSVESFTIYFFAKCPAVRLLNRVSLSLVDLARDRRVKRACGVAPVGRGPHPAFDLASSTARSSRSRAWRHLGRRRDLHTFFSFGGWPTSPLVLRGAFGCRFSSPYRLLVGVMGDDRTVTSVREDFRPPP